MKRDDKKNWESSGIEGERNGKRKERRKDARVGRGERMRGRRREEKDLR